MQTAMMTTQCLFVFTLFRLTSRVQFKNSHSQVFLSSIGLSDSHSLPSSATVMQATNRRGKNRCLSIDISASTAVYVLPPFTIHPLRHQPAIHHKQQK